MGKIKFVLLDVDSLEQVRFLYQNQNDPRWNHLIIPQGPQFPPKAKNPEEFQKELLKSPFQKEHYLISIEDQFIGDISLMVDPPCS